MGAHLGYPFCVRNAWREGGGGRERGRGGEEGEGEGEGGSQITCG